MNARLRAVIGLTLSFLPGALFAGGLFFLFLANRLPWPGGAAGVPWEAWAVGATGIAGAVAAIADYRYHTRVVKAVSPLEERVELIALGFGGLPMFVVMAMASFAHDPRPFLPAVAALLAFTTAAICYDEFVFHRRRCAAYENALHKVIVGGNGAAWLAWFHWVFVRARAF
jgi:hypothetical protein